MRIFQRDVKHRFQIYYTAGANSTIIRLALHIGAYEDSRKKHSRFIGHFYFFQVKPSPLL